MRKSSQSGILYLVGAGPGDPGLLTIRGLQCLESADAVIYDYLASPRLLSYAPAEAEMIYVGKKAGAHTMPQEDINRLLVEKVKAGKTVVRLKGGDPFVFGRGGEECEALLEAGLLFEVVPGITAGIAAAAYAGIPVTHRSMASSMALITGHEDPTKESSSINWEHLAVGIDTLIFYMGVSNLSTIAQQLMRHGRPAATPVGVIQWGTTPQQRTVVGTLETIADIVAQNKITAPAITIVGKVVSLRENLRWLEKRPLFGKKIVVTRSRSQASALSNQLLALGAEVTELPTIAIVPNHQDPSLQTAAARCGSYDWIVFTSPNGVEAFFELLLNQAGDVRALGGAKLACIGSGTAQALRGYKVKPAVIAREAIAEGLVRELADKDSWKGRTVLLPRAAKARDVLPKALQSWGAQVTVVTAYHTVKPDTVDEGMLEDIASGNYHLITFTSSSTVENFFDLIPAELMTKISSGLRAASIGPVTSSTLRSRGVVPVVEAQDHTIPGLIDAIRKNCEQ
jgi:uroporphyrinogen III methyltransferase/synthase